MLTRARTHTRSRAHTRANTGAARGGGVWEHGGTQEDASNVRFRICIYVLMYVCFCVCVFLCICANASVPMYLQASKYQASKYLCTSLIHVSMHLYHLYTCIQRMCVLCVRVRAREPRGERKHACAHGERMDQERVHVSRMSVLRA